MSAVSERAAEPDGAARVEALARGGALNLIGNAVYGAASFLLLVIVTTRLGAGRAGILLVSVALFNILAKTCELGGATGLIRTVSRNRALHHEHELRAYTHVAVAASFVGGLVAACAMYAAAPTLARAFGNGRDLDAITDVLRALAPFLPFACTYSVIVQGTRGFDTMVPQVTVEKIGKSIAQPVVVLVVLIADGGLLGAAYAWATVQLVATAPALLAYGRLLRTAELRAVESRARVTADLARSFLAYSLPRALGQVFQVTVLWLDTLLIAGLVGTTEAGIYAAGTRFLLIGLFTAEAIMQVLGPRISGLLALHRRDDARDLYVTATAWQAALTWNVYLVVAAFTVPLLRIFGSEYVAAGPALVWLSLAMLAACVFGPSDTVILMSGRSRLSLLNAFVGLVVNVTGNLVLVPRYGITGAGATWAVTLVVMAALPAWQAARTLGLHPFGRPVAAAVGCSVATFGAAALLARALVGPGAAGLATAVVVGLAGFVVALRRLGDPVRLELLVRNLVRAPTRTTRSDRPRSDAMAVLPGGAGR